MSHEQGAQDLGVAQEHGGDFVDEAAHLVLEGADLYVEQVGPKGAPVVYYLHGGPGYSAHAFRELLGEELEDYRMVYADQRGGGRSYADQPFDLDAMADDVAAVLRGLELGPATLLAHGFGAIVAVRAATRHPGSVRGLALVNPWLSMPMLARTLQREAAHLSGHGEEALPPESALAEADALDPHVLVDAAFSWVAPKVLFDRLQFPDPTARMRLEHADATALLGPTETTELDAPWTLQLTEEWAALRQPAAVLLSTRDGTSYPDQAEAILQARPDALTALLDGGHHPYVEEADDFLTTLRQALAHAGARPAQPPG